jgi:hypothetical protein
MTLCGANCGECGFKENCRGCEPTGGRPFGGECVAAEYIKAGGREKYAEFKSALLGEINSLLGSNGLPLADGLCELAGFYVNLAYPLPSGETIKLLDDKKIYLGAQIECGDLCFGVIADTTFILVCSYSLNGSEPELLLYKKR